MSNEYKIERWDGLISGNNVNPKPIIYIKPDFNFLNFISLNNNRIQVVVKNSNTPYDNFKYNALVNMSGNIPNCRPNLFDETGWYVIILDAEWIGQPDTNNKGSVIIDGLSMNDESYVDLSSTLKSLNANEAGNGNGSTFYKRGLVVMIVVLILLAIILNLV